MTTVNKMKKSNSSRAINGISNQSIATISVGIVEIVFFSIISRLLTKEDFGYYAAISAIVAVLGSFSETGIGSAVIQRKEIEKKYIDNAFTLSLLFGVTISFILMILSGLFSNVFVDDSVTLPLMLMSTTLLFHCMTSVNTSIMYRRLEFLRIGIITLLSSVISSVIAIVLALEGFGVYSIVAKSVLFSALCWVFSLYFCNTHFSIRIDKSIAYTILNYSGWLMASVVFRNISQQIDKIMMPRLLSVNALGAYNRPKEFVSQISSRINGIFDTALFPILSSIQDEKDRLENSFLKSLYFLNLFSLVLCMEFCFNSKLLIYIFLGEEWLSLEKVFIIISLSIIFNIDGRLADCYLRSLALTKQQFYFRVIETVLKMGGTVIGSQWDIVGVVIAITTIDVIMKIFKLMYVSYKLQVDISVMIKNLFSSWRISLTMIPLCLISILIMPDTMTGCVFLQCFYILLCFILFVLTPNLIGEKYHKEFLVPLIEKIKK